MSKTTNSRKSQPSSPNADQIAAVRRLIDQGDAIQANQRLAVLRKSFPEFKPLLGLAWEIEDECGMPMRASARALEWQQASPNSRAAVQALYESAGKAGLSTIYGRALGRLEAMDGREVFQLPSSFSSPHGAISLAQAEALDLSRMHLGDNNPRAAVAVLQGVDHPSARNNLALALFVAGDVKQASSVVEANWQAEPNNLFALESAVRWRCWLQGMDRCRGFMAPLQHTDPRRSQDAISRVLALRFLVDDEVALKAWEDSATADYWSLAGADQRETFDDLKNPVAQWPGGSAMWFPSGWIEELKVLSGKSKGASDKLVEPKWDGVLATCDAHVDYLVRVVHLGDEVARFLALSVLKHRAKQNAAESIAGLTALLTNSKGPDAWRMDLLNWLVEHELRSATEPADVWLNGELRTIRSQSFTITDEAQASPFPPKGTVLNERVLEAIGLGNLRLAHDLAAQLYQMHPEQPSALTNLAAVKEGLGVEPTEITDLYRRAHAIAPDYLFARCGLARALTREGKVDDARKLLEGLMEREVFHRSEYRSLLLTQQALALAVGDEKAARGLADAVADLERDVDD